MARKQEKTTQPRSGAGSAVRVAEHARAPASIRRWRGWAGFAGLILATWFSLRAGVPAFDAVLRGLLCGLAAQFVAWAGAVIAWRHLVIAELAAHRAEAERRAAERLASRGA
jgi:hypothetical protein